MSLRVVASWTTLLLSRIIMGDHHSLGTLVHCSDTETPCKWTDGNGRLITRDTLHKVMLAKYHVSAQERDQATQNLIRHTEYIDAVMTYATSIGYEFPYRMGVSARHLNEGRARKLSPRALVEKVMRAQESTRRLADSPANPPVPGNVSIQALLNWCTTDNPLGRSVCSGVKSQENCGSCWAFAATDAIETAVSVVSNTSAVALSPQQLLQCSTRSTTQKFKYCWSSDSGVNGAAWLTSEVTWESQNNGCDGGMTHGAFMDAAQLSIGLVTELKLPYDDTNIGSWRVNASFDVCNVPAAETAASITGWEQVVGGDCSVSTSASVLLRSALQRQPIAVAINSEDPFNDYKGGFFTCPNNGNFPSKDDLNHALLLVGYGTDAARGDYWILKNSYGSNWGDRGFLKLTADTKINCGLNVFPVLPTGAKAGAKTTAVDGGGEDRYLSLSAGAWIAIAIAASAATIILTLVGLVVVRRRRNALRQEAVGLQMETHM
uniref:Cysteine protease family C01A putative n=1 Tax=Albugo laibachii Nc14 TaxID=890382 RepID=F0WMW2_9STRA|nr:cysteine protease family C01A putative [Albugo laibachii Nc14]|eukprot:CCA22647.1 cysteine protease family C01A putative [Albugo laibachii Nc14]